jgi:hypothetical protein
MQRTLVFTGFLIVLTLTACSTSSPPVPVLPTILAPTQLAAPAPNEAYPTSQAVQTNSSQTVSGFTVSLQRAWRDGKQVHAAVCFTLPDASDWTIWTAHFDYGGGTIAEFSASLISKQDATGGQPARRCDELVFYVPPDADLSAANLTIESLGAYPTADEYCSLYMPKIQQALKERGIDIVLNCAEVNGTMTMQVVSKPANMSQEDAEKLVYSDEFYTVKGPWTFAVTFSQ